MRRRLLAAAAVATLTPAALAQEAMYTNAATMPSTGIMLARQQFHLFESGFNPETGDERVRTFQYESSLQVGLDVGWSLTVKAVGEHERVDLAGGGHDTEDDLASVDFMVKHRFYMNNPGGVDTERAALMFGARVDAEDSANVDPHIGIVYTRVSGLHGFNAELHYTWTTGGEDDSLDNTLGGEGEADALNYNLAYVYRVFPAVYTADSTGAWYVTAEINGLYETNGDNEVRFSPGLMYEGRRFGFEIMAQLPLANDLDHRPELDWGIGVGFRLLF
ncbi:MAG TPA: hypothetical protein VFF65_07950 [Phycisphaerales bacterium]|nr:hypothetical protein [Phycisphaerales bacterium]